MADGNDFISRPYGGLTILSSAPWSRAPPTITTIVLEPSQPSLDFWHAMEHTWGFARLRFGEGSTQADQWVHQIGVDLKAGEGEQVNARLKCLRPKSRNCARAWIR